MSEIAFPAGSGMLYLKILDEPTDTPATPDTTVTTDVPHLENNVAYNHEQQFKLYES